MCLGWEVCSDFFFNEKHVFFVFKGVVCGLKGLYFLKKVTKPRTQTRF